MKTSKKIISAFLAFVLALSTVTVAFAADSTPQYTGKATRGTYAGILQDADDMLADAVFTGDTLETLWGIVPDMMTIVAPEAADASFYVDADPDLFAELPAYMAEVGADTVTSVLLTGVADDPDTDNVDETVEGYFDEHPVVVESGDAFAEHADRYIDAVVTAETVNMIAVALTGNFEDADVVSFCKNMDSLCQALGIAQPAGLYQIITNALNDVNGADYQMRVYLKNVLFYFVPDTAEGLMNLLRAIAEPENSAAFYESVIGLLDNLDTVLAVVGGLTPEMQAQIDEIKGIINNLPTTTVKVNGEDKTIFNINGTLQYLINDVIFPQLKESLDPAIVTGINFLLALYGNKVISFDGSRAYLQFSAIDLTKLSAASDAVDTLNLVLHYFYVNLNSNKGRIESVLDMAGDSLPEQVSIILSAVLNESEPDAVFVIYQQLHMLATNTETEPTDPPEEPAATPVYDVTASAGANGQVSPAAQTIVSGRDTFVQITANEGYVIDALTVNDKAVDEAAGQSAYVLQLTNVTAATEVNVTFKEFAVEPVAYTVSASAGANGQVSPETQTVEEGEDATVQVTANEGYVIDTLTVNGQPVAEAVDQASYVLTLSDVMENKEIRAAFKLEVVEPVEYTVTVSVGENGTATPQSVTVADGESATIQITANEGYVIDSLTVNGEPVADVAGLSSYALQFDDITENKEVSVTFKAEVVVPTEYTVTATAGANGTVSPASQSVEAGKDATVQIKADTGYVIDTVTVNGQPVVAAAGQAAYSLVLENVNENTEVSATFKAEVIVPTEYTVTATAGENGTVSPASQSVEAGKDATVQIKADTGYVIDTVTVNGQPVAAAAGQAAYSLVLKNVNENTEVSATFKTEPVKPTEYTVTATAGANGTATPATQKVEAGQTATVQIQANGGHMIDTLTVDGNPVSEASGQTAYTYTLTVNADTNISVTFAVRRKAQVMVSALNVKDSASIFGKTLVQLTSGNMAYIDGEDGDWYKVSFTKGGVSYNGYLEKKYVKIIAGQAKDKGIVVASTAKVYTNTNATSTEATLKRGQYAYIDGESGSYYLVSFSLGGWHYGYIRKDYLRDDSLDRTYTSTWSERQGQVMVNEVIVRESMDTNSEPVTVLALNNKIYINGEENGWYKVSFTLGGEPYEGYVEKQYFKIAAGTAKPSGIVVAATANVYTATYLGKIESTLKRGQFAYIDAEVGDYYLVSFSLGGKWHYGYVLKDYLRDSSLPRDYKVDSANKIGIATVTANEVIVRDTTDENSAPVTVLVKNNKVYVNEDAGDWYKVSFTLGGEPYEGYVLKTEVNLPD